MYVLICFFKTNHLEVMTPEAAARQLGTSLHTIAFNETIEVDHVNWKVFAAKLKVYDPNLQVKEVSHFHKLLLSGKYYNFFSRKAPFRTV